MEEKLDIREKGGVRNGVQQVSDRRLFMQLLAFGDAEDAAPLIRALESARIPGVLYVDANDPHGVALLTWSDSPDFFVNELRQFLKRGEFAALTPKLEYSMLGRTYALGHEPDLDDWLFERPKRTVTNGAWQWAVWYPLRRAGAFSALPPEEQMPMLREHGKVGHAFGEAELAHDVRLACFGLDKQDNDFIIGLIGTDLFPLSACVQAMRRTRQTSQYIQQMGPFFIGKAVWQAQI